LTNIWKRLKKFSSRRKGRERKRDGNKYEKAISQNN
jgi:hypothetical protein